MRYICTDLHGQYKLWEQIKETLNENDTLYFLGDAVDRGYDGIKIMTEMLADPRVIYFRGNHEQMMYDSVIGIYKDYEKIIKGDEDIPFPGKSWYLFNGGDETTEYLWRNYYTIEEIEKLREMIEKMPLHMEVQAGDKTIYLSHSGYEPFIMDKDWIMPFEKRSTTQMRYIWDRDHIHMGWKKQNISKFPHFDFDNSYVIHGHTPVVSRDMLEKYMDDNNIPISKEGYLQLNDFKKEPKIFQYAEGHKINLDLGSFVTGVAALFNLDTFETQYFYDESKNKSWVKEIENEKIHLNGTK